MSDVQADILYREIIFHDDNVTPAEFLLELVHSVFKKQLADSIRFIDAIQQEGKAVCGSYPRDIAGELLEAARQHIDESGHPLRITSREIPTDATLFDAKCVLCGDLFGHNKLSFKGTVTRICDECMDGISSQLSQVIRERQFEYAYQALASHFNGIPPDRLVATSRQFPDHMRADVQAGIDKLFLDAPLRFFGIYEQNRYETLSLAALSRDGRNALTIAAAQYHDVDVGESAPVKCLDNGLWLCRTGDLRYAVVLSADREHGRESGVRVEIAVPVGADGAEFVQRCFSELERAVNEARCYRGKVISLDAERDYRGRTRGVMVHKLPAVQREEVILPEATLKLLDRNVLSFVKNRPLLRQLGQSTRKGILLYGPPGTGKTHTIRYLANNLPATPP
jgi:ATP-dependent Clp protease adapter protein ClpS